MAQVKAPATSTKTILIIAAIILLIIIIIAWYFYHQGKKTTTIATVPADVPTGTNNPAAVSSADIAKISGDLYNEMNGFNWSRNTAPYHAYMDVSDTDFANVYNLFNTNYQPASGQTLTGWINGEKSIYDPDFDSVKADILQRLSRLNLP